MEGALDLLSHPPQVRQRVLPALHDEPARMPEPGAQRGVVRGGIAGECGDDAHGRLVVPPRSRRSLRMLLAVAGDDLKVTLQSRLELTSVSQTVQVIHGALFISSR
jgi:hypothetical protein